MDASRGAHVVDVDQGNSSQEKSRNRGSHYCAKAFNSVKLRRNDGGG
jgi:hypothetical protein